MEKGNIVYEKDKESKIAKVTFNRPEKLNAFIWPKMFDEVIKIVQEVNEDDDVKVLIFKGAGDCFTSGLDVADIYTYYGGGTGKPGELRPSQRSRLTMDRSVWGPAGFYETILRCKKATINQVHGYCYGTGLEIALSSDIVIAAENALFTHPGFSYIGPLGNIALYIETIGPKKTKEMMLTGRPLTASEAYRVGLVNKVVPLGDLEEEVNEMAKAIALLAIDAIVMGKSGFEVALDALGAATGSTTAYIMHSIQTNIRYEPGEYNLLRERREKGVKGATLARKAHYGH